MNLRRPSFPASAATKSLQLALVLAGATSFVACADNKEVAKTIIEGPGSASARPTVVAAPPLPTSKVRQLEFSENDFTESDKSRDPFRSYASGFAEQAKKTSRSQLKVLLPEFSIDELKLVAIVGGGDYPRAMMIDPQGKGWVLKKGDFVGRPDVVHTGGSNGTDYQLNWRVDRVRADDIVFVREDPAQPGIPPATRVITLHPEGDKEKGREG